MCGKTFFVHIQWLGSLYKSTRPAALRNEMAKANHEITNHRINQVKSLHWMLNNEFHNDDNNNAEEKRYENQQNKFESSLSYFG